MKRRSFISSVAALPAVLIPGLAKRREKTPYDRFHKDRPGGWAECKHDQHFFLCRCGRSRNVDLFEVVDNCECGRDTGQAAAVSVNKHGLMVDYDPPLPSFRGVSIPYVPNLSGEHPMSGNLEAIRGATP